MTRPLLIALVLIVYIVYVGFKHKEIWKKLSLLQIIGVFFTFAGVVSISGIILYYGSRYITSAVSSNIMDFAIKFVLIIIVIAAAGLIFSSIAGKITNGVISIERRHKKN
ncbi:hypothetical protein SAMN04488072_1181 [Lentibacillus halodurans]|uniref:Uncharacterized protein n=1 Tax=Lentibacillus halodurans TaxID=237679 RepID=A0A1I1AAJ5_9BACI|nr:hypothetical protein [Lentibacillus halodurans]SFB34967.1 hypothetical protein SAMN04488072_1181 [Lentibacillus halodurans]